MPTYTIVIKNKSPEKQNYLLFQDPPRQDGRLGKIWSNVWVKTGSTPTPNGAQRLTIIDDMFAICGNSTKSLAQGVSVQESDYAGPVSLNPGTQTAVSMDDGNPSFDPPPYSTLDTQNSFGINMKPYDAKLNPNVVIGLGKYNDKNEVVPVLSFNPKGNVNYAITPNVTYYIATGDYKAGEVVDITAYGGKVAVNFTHAPPGYFVATVTHNTDGSYSEPEFSKPSGQRLSGDEE